MLRLIFWNCGVAPSRGSAKRSPIDAAQVIDEALQQGASLFGLCEVNEETLQAIAREVGAPLSHVSLAESVGGSRWDLGVLYDSNVLNCERMAPAVGHDHGAVVKAACSVRVAGEASFLRLYLLHWRSRLRGAQPHRQSAATTLHQSIQEDLRKDTPVVVVGDFNDEPHDASLTTLHSSRDPRLVIERPSHYLYNPCWPLACAPLDQPWRTFGSYSRPGGSTSNAYLLDQALTSSHFLDLDRQVAPSVALRSYRALQSPSKSPDHLPLELSLPWDKTIHSIKP
jgi:Endonuclease/Exonuclease/phosphatase family